MLDSYNREINYLRISVTDKCNLRCIYCMPEDGIKLRPHEEFLSFEQIVAVVKAAVRLGLTKIRLTGGEPLVKRDFVDLVRMIAGIDGVKHIGVTTNGVLLKPMAADLKAAGLSSINISLDTLDAERYRKITRVGSIEHVLEGIEAAVALQFPIKINMVVLDETTVDEIERMRKFCLDRGIKLQLINHFSLNVTKYNDYTFDRPPKCEECNRIRLLADGHLKPCLHSDLEIPLDFNDIEKSLRQTIANKPERGTVCENRLMYEIGG